MKFVSVMDIGTSKITIMFGKMGLNNSLNVIGYYEHHYSGYFDGNFVEENKINEDIVSALANAEKAVGVKIKKIYVGVPADFSTCVNKNFVQSFGDKRKITENDIAEIYSQVNELKNNTGYILINCSPIKFVLDDGREVLNPEGEKTSRLSGELCYVYAENKFIYTVNQALKQFGLDTVEYISSTTSTNNYLLPASERINPCIVVDCGYISTSVSISKGNGLLHLSSFSVGGGQITSDLSDCLKISYKEADNLKKQVILSVVPELSDGYEIVKNNQTSLISMRETNDIVSARLEMICSLINKCLSSIDKRELFKMPFYLTGGGICFIKGAKDYLSKYFGVNIDILCPPNLEYNRPNYSCPMGLMNMALNIENKKNSSKLINFFKRITKR